jgi:hypothetical protein
MKKTMIFVTLVLVLTSFHLQAQDVEAKLSEATSSYRSGDLENARFALQQALQAINQAIGQEILGFLPAEIGKMRTVEASDNATGMSAGFAGLFVQREYSGENRTGSIEILSDSPMVSGINALLSLPTFMATDPNQKRIKVAGYKALLNKSTDDQGIVSYQMQLPFGSSLLTFNCTGIPDEKEVTQMYDTLPIEKIVKTAQ